MVYLLLNIPNIIYMPPISVPFQAVFIFPFSPQQLKTNIWLILFSLGLKRPIKWFHVDP